MKWWGRTWFLGPRAPQPGPVGQVAWLFETAIAFAGENWVFLVCFSGAEVMRVSLVPCCGCAVVLLVSTSPCCRASCAMVLALLGLMRVRARRSSPCVLTMAKSWRLMERRASFFAEMRLEGLCWASFVADQHSWDPAGRVCCAAGLVAAHLLAVLTLQCAAKPYWWRGGQFAQGTTYRVSVRIKGAAQTQVRAAPHKQSAQCSPSCSFRRS